MSEELKAKAEFIRACVRPIMIGFFLITSFYFIVSGTQGLWVDAWIGLTIFGCGEWVLERPISKLGIKIIGKE